MNNNLGKFRSISVRIVSLLVATGFCAVALAQPADAVLTTRFNQYQQQGLRERMFLHTDKEFYVAGEICWFKVYSVDAIFHKPLDVSKVGYVELLDNNNKAVLQSKVEMDSSTGNGSLFVPVTINSGHYKLRAYSKWMKNFDPTLFFEKPLTIINTQKATDQTASNFATTYDIRFFPEGGNLVNGLQSKVAFSVKDHFGKSVDCKLSVVSGKDTLTSVNAQHFGMGTFMLTPQSGQTYSAIVYLDNGVVVRRELPAAYKTGYVMQVTEEGERRLRIAVSSSESTEASEMLYLFVQSRGILKTVQGSALQNGKAIFLVEKSRMGEGISQLTIFNSEKKPLCERLYFRQPTSAGLKLTLNSDATVYATRQKINLAIATTDGQNNPASANMSMTVFRLDSLQQPALFTINEYLWLLADLPGFVESPAYYFTAGASSGTIDQLMLVNGWRRFDWEKVLENKKEFFKFSPEQKGLLVTGKVVNAKTGLPAPNVRAFLSVPGANPLFRSSLSDAQGGVKFEMKGMAGTPGIIVQAAAEDSSTYRVEIDNPFSTEYSKRTMSSFSLPLKYSQTLAAHNLGAQVENLYSSQQRMKVKESTIDTTQFYFRPNEIYYLDSYTRFTTMEEVLREYVFSVGVRRRNGKFFLPVYNDADKYNGMFDKNSLILLDGVPLFDVDKFMQFDPLKIRRLETVTRRYFFGNTAFDGIVNMFTYTGDLQGYELDLETTVIDYEGLQLQREFYAPTYETLLQVASRVPDFRNVLSWKPDLVTGAEGKSQASFYSSDLPGKYMVEVQGISSTGIPGVARMVFEVKKPAK